MTRWFKRAITAFAACAAAASLPCPVQAQAFPSKPLRIIVPFGPGTGSDVLARAIGDKLSQSIGQPVVIDNRQGAGGLVGAQAIQASPADGYTLMMAANPFVVSPLLYEKPPYDALKDFVPVAKVAEVPNVLIVNAKVPAKTMKELIAYAKSVPGQLNYASSGKGTPSQLEMELLKSTYGMDIVEVPYKNTGEAMTDVIAGQVGLYFPTLPAALPQIKAGRVRALGVGSARRLPSAPEIPTMAEALGAPDYEAHTWYGFVVLANTPPEIVAKLRAEINKAMRTPEVRERVSALGADMVSTSSDEFTQQMRGEISKWTRLIKSIGLKAD